MLLAARLFALGLVAIVAWSVGVGGVRAVGRQRSRVDALRARVALLEREVRNGLRDAHAGLRAARERLTDVRGGLP